MIAMLFVYLLSACMHEFCIPIWFVNEDQSRLLRSLAFFLKREEETNDFVV
jgi:hypothetical protein